jgi:hypothetical protein
LFKGKYAKYFTTDIKEESILPPDIIPGPTFGFRGARQIQGACANFGWNVIYRPYFIDRVAHVHDGDEYLFFLGAQIPDCFTNYDFEVDFYFGKEQELYTITEPALVFIPKGMIHAPLDFREINKPLFFGMLLLTPSYSLTDVDGKKVSFDGPGIDGATKTIDLSNLGPIKHKKSVK